MAFVGDTLNDLARLKPNALALTCADRRWTRAEFFSEVLALTTLLKTRVLKEARVALSLRDPARLLVAFFAVARSGAVAMIYDPDWPAGRRAWIDRETHPVLLLDDETLARLLALPVEGSSDRSDPEAFPEGTDPFYAGFTSGSTGDPKGYCRSHKSWLESFDVSAREFAIGADDHVIVPGNMVHSLHLYGAVHGMVVGAHVEVVERFNPRALSERMRRPGSPDSAEAQTSLVFYATPTQIHYVAEDLRRAGAASSVRLVLASGAKWRDDDRRRMKDIFPEARLVEFYGASEMSFITLAGPEDNLPPGSVGRAASGVSIRIMSDQGDELQPGELGTIWVSSQMLFDGYICGGGSEVARNGAWLTVGDQGFLNAEGFLFLTGRQKRMIVTAGLNIYPEEVEQVLLSHSLVGLAAVLPVADPVRGQVMVAFVSPEQMPPDQAASGENASNLEDQLRRHCLRHLGKGRTPRRFIIRSALPLTPGGKVDLMALETDLLQGTETND
ncbi:AMP-binding protein [Roseibium algae]|uniref:AMP-binding protein n=1 Tax=Roseibium algae TaxID=3123038 RepID=A0ABU8TRM6_9HYPH